MPLTTNCWISNGRPREAYRHLPCPKCQVVGKYQFKDGKITCLSCGRELKEF